MLIKKKLFFLSILLVCFSCIQNPSPVFLRGEEFHGRRELDEKHEYYLTKDYFGHKSGQKNSKNKSNQIVIREVTANMEQEVKIRNVSCDFIMPVVGNILSRFNSYASPAAGDTAVNNETNQGDCREGINIAADEGSKVMASAGGKVIYIGRGLRWYGNMIIIEHDKNIITLYSYLHNIYVNQDDKVKQGQVIASVGKVNNKVDDKPYICLTMRQNSVVVNPLTYINCR